MSTGVLKPSDLKQIAEKVEMSKAQEAVERQRKEHDEERKARQMFLERDLRPDALERFNSWVRRAAEQGHREIEIGRFPAEYCTDHGRSINNFDESWPEALTGIAKRVYEVYEKILKPDGYKIRAQILNYPDGNLGEVGLFIGW